MNNPHSNTQSAVAFLIASAILAFIAIVLFKFGSPGTAALPAGPNFDQSRIAVYSPRGLKADIQITYYVNEYGAGQDGQYINFEIANNGPAVGGVIVIELQGLALYRDLQACCYAYAGNGYTATDGPKVVGVSDLNPVPTRLGDISGDDLETQLILLQVPKGFAESESSGAFMGGLIRHPVANRDNEVVAANLPEIKEPQSCPELARLKVADVLKLKLREWSRITYTCTPARPSHTDSLQIAERAADVSIESASLAPTDAARLLWSSRHVIPSIAVNYVLLGRQAEGARLLFLAGAAVGLSGAFLPLGIEPLARTVLDRRRRGRQSSLRVRQKRSALPKNYGQEGTRLYRHKSRLTPRRRR